MNLPFCLVSKAYSPADREPPLAGIRHYAAAAHGLGLPVTWVIDPRGCSILQEELSAWHTQFGDDIAMAVMGLPITGEAYAERRAALRALCPWSAVTVSGAGGHKSETMMAALESAGIEGHWGYCWEQAYVDDITDYGQTPGLFFVSRNSYKMPGGEKEGLVAIEWLSRDLNKAFWTGNPVHFAGEPDAFAVMGDWPEEESLAYFGHVVDQYLRNARAGQPLPFIFQEEAEQLMERLGREYAGIWPRLIAWMEKALTPLATHPEITFTTLPRIVRRFRAGDWSWPRLYRAADRACLPLHDPRDGRKRSRIYGAALQFPEVLHYCSTSVFATFQAGSPFPVRLIRYDRQQSCDVSRPLAQETHLPRLLSLHRKEQRWEVTLESGSAQPFALCLPLEPGEAPPTGCPRNEDSWVWEFSVEAGRTSLISPTVS